jgi:hypothetical protein
LSRGRDGSLVREMEDAQIQLENERMQAALDEPPPALLRGLLTVTLSKPSRIKDISVRLKGVARTDWPEGAIFSLSSCLFLLISPPLQVSDHVDST